MQSMKRTRSVAIGVIVLSIVAIIVIVISLLNVAPQAEPSLTPTSTEVATSTPTITPTADPCAPENLRDTIMEFDKISREFSDTFVLAQNTAAAQLSPTIIELQRIRRSAED